MPLFLGGLLHPSNPLLPQRPCPPPSSRNSSNLWRSQRSPGLVALTVLGHSLMTFLAQGSLDGYSPRHLWVLPHLSRKEPLSFSKVSLSEGTCQKGQG